MNNMFDSCSQLIQLDVSNWDTSKVTRMDVMFYQCSSLTTIGDVSKWDTSNVIYMGSMFHNCSQLTQLNVSNWNTSNVTNMQSMFNSCSQLTQLDVSNWDTSNVQYMNYIFSYCSQLTQLDVSKWNTSNVATMSHMFQSCSKLTQLNVSNWDTSNVASMSSMFQDCSQLTQLDVSKWDTSNATNMSYMFYNCSQLTQLDVSNWNTSKVTTMNNMFDSCSQLIQLDVSNWDTSKVTTLTSTIFRPHTLLLNWSIKEINRLVATNTTYSSTVYVKHDISKLTQNNLITYVNYIGDEISISLPQPLRRIGDVCDRLYWDYDKGYYCIEQNIDINENDELCIIEPVIIELTDMNEKVEIDVYETTKIGFIDTPIDPTETIINQDMINYKIEQLESSTEYTIQFNCLAKIKENNIRIKINEEVIETPTTLGINKVKITTPSNITDKTRIVLYGEGNIIKDVMLVKGDLNQDLKYFEGIQGFGELQEDGSYKITIVSDNYSWLWKE